MSGTVFHIVSFKFKPDVSAQDLAEIGRAFEGLQRSISQVRSLDGGANVSTEGHAKGHTHCWVLTFASLTDRDTYLVHPDHVAFAGQVGPLVEDVFVVDFIS